MNSDYFPSRPATASALLIDELDAKQNDLMVRCPHGLSTWGRRNELAQSKVLLTRLAAGCEFFIAKCRSFNKVRCHRNTRRGRELVPQPVEIAALLPKCSVLHCISEWGQAVGIRQGIWHVHVDYVHAAPARRAYPRRQRGVSVEIGKAAILDRNRTLRPT